MTSALRSLLAVAVAAGGLASARAAVAAPGETYAVVIGWNGGNRELGPLRYADDDAARFALFFRGMEGANPAPGAVRLLTEIDDDTRATLAAANLTVVPDGPPTRDAVLAAFTELGRTLAARPAATPRGRRVLYVVYAGHGLEGRVLLKPTEGAEAGLTGAELRAALAGVAAGAPDLEILVFLDACRAQSLFSERGAPDGTGPDLGDAITALEQRSARLSIGVLTASRSGRPAGEVRRLGAGFFSHVLTSGLAGAADADGDDVVTFGELAAFVAFHTQRLTGQMPWFAPPDGDLGAGAIDHRGRQGRLVIPAPEAGRFLVGAPGGLPVFAEAYKSAGRSLKLALPAGHYRVLREGAGGGAGTVAAFDLRADVDLGSLTWSPPPVAARGEDEALGREDPRFAFRTPFSEGIVSTLAAGFHAGREPAVARTGSGHELAAGVGLGGAPLELGGVEPRLELGYRYHFGGAFLGFTVSAASSSHQGSDGRYDLRRFAAGPTLGWSAFAAGPVELGVHAGGGAGSVLRASGGGNSGDLFAPFVTAGARAALRVGSDGWFGALTAGVLVQWVRVDAARQASTSPIAGLLAGRMF
jgi:hypothetical protein